MQIFTKRKKDGKEMFAFEKKFLADHLKLPAKTGKVAAGKRKSAGDGPGNPKHAKIIVLEESDEEWDPSAAAPHSNHANSTTNRRAEKTPDNNSDDDSEDDSDDDQQENQELANIFGCRPLEGLWHLPIIFTDHAATCLLLQLHLGNFGRNLCIIATFY